MTGLLQRLPLLRSRAALAELREQLRQVRAKNEALKTELADANAERRALRSEKSALESTLAGVTERAQQAEFSSRSLGTGDLHLLWAPVAAPARLAEIVRDHASTYRNADPFPHLVVDGFIEPAILDRVLAEFEAIDRGRWHHSDGTHERKWSMEHSRRFGPFTAALIAQLNGGPFISFLEELTGIEGLVADPHLRSGGLHEIRQGGLLGVHADFNFHKRLIEEDRDAHSTIFLTRDVAPSAGTT